MDRIKLKDRAKDFLSGGRYVRSLVYTFFVTLLSMNFLMYEFTDPENPSYYIGFLIKHLKRISLDSFLKLNLLHIFLVIFIVPMFAVSLYKYYMRDYSDMEAFTSEKFLSVDQEDYGNLIKIFAFRGIKILLWSLLLIIPGLVKSYEYFAIPYILAEKPKMDMGEVFDLSKEMMDGNKMNIFILRLSFLGWIIVGAIIPGSIFLINPYMEATFTQAYLDIKENKGINIA